MYIVVVAIVVVVAVAIFSPHYNVPQILTLPQCIVLQVPPFLLPLPFRIDKKKKLLIANEFEFTQSKQFK